jgi:hypothetical protein
VELISHLRDASPEFGQWWPRHDVKSRDTGTKVLHHPATGRVTLTHTVLHIDEAPEQKLVIYYAEPGSEDAERLARLPLP